MTLRVTDFLRKLDGHFNVTVLKKHEDGFYEELLDDTLFLLNEQCEKSFDPLEGFDNPVWEMEVKNFWFTNTHVTISV